MSNSPIQKILFGSPGTGKSHKIKTHYAGQLGIDPTSENYIATVFHPEYTYGDFMGKLMPLTKENKVEYKFYAGHFLKALAQAYKQILIYNLKKAGTPQDADTENDDTFQNSDAQNDNALQNVLLVVDEINRGNSAAIFGTVFQLLDRNSNGSSEYSVNISDLEFSELLLLIGLREKTKTTPNDDNNETITITKKHSFKANSKTYNKSLSDWLALLQIKNNQIKIPSNLSIIATMNTSDNSIYFMDNAFKRRWDWEFIEIEDEKQKAYAADHKIIINSQNPIDWVSFVDNLNAFIRSKYKVVRKIEDKQIGYCFITKKEILEEDIKSKLMFFVWDSVFTTDKKPLVELLFTDKLMSDNEKNSIISQKEKDLITFGQFSQKDNFILFVDKIRSLNV